MFLIKSYGAYIYIKKRIKEFCIYLDELVNLFYHCSKMYSGYKYIN